jgi:hypothetical protein
VRLLLAGNRPEGCVCVEMQSAVELAQDIPQHCEILFGVERRFMLRATRSAQ